MSTFVVIKPELITWARQRVDFAVEDLARAVGVKNISIVYEWEKTGKIKLSQLEKIAKKTHTPVGYMFLSTPPEEKLPIPDFRTLKDANLQKPSPNLLDTIFNCQSRQEWFKDYLLSNGAEPLPFVGSISAKDDPGTVAYRIRKALDLVDHDRSTLATWEDAAGFITEKIEGLGVLVMKNGVVGSNTHRKLNVHEFRGFCLSDTIAPLIFVNSTDAKSAQMFTLIHELVHVWLGASGVSNTNLVADETVENFCNTVAAEVLVPSDEITKNWLKNENLQTQVARLSRLFKVSTLVILIKAHQLRLIESQVFFEYYNSERSKGFRAQSRGGGNFYRTQGSRLSNRFIRAVVGSTLEGRSTYSEAFELLSIKKSKTFNNFAESLMGAR